MKKNPLRVYADTSVFGGAFDAEFQTASQAFFAQVQAGHFILVISSLVRDELEEAPATVRELYQKMLPRTEMLSVGDEEIRLSEAYMKAGIVTPNSAEDAMHVALATVSNCAAIVSWNFRHIVHFQKIPLYNAVNALYGYRNIAICSPQEVIDYEDENQDL
jgi:predicted nucleic acid-binding protein